MSGFDVEVAKYVAKKLGVEESGITWKETPSAQRETALQNQEVDFIVATYSITDKRKQVVDFAGPYFIAHQDLLVKSDNTSICGPNDLNGKLLCSVKGSTSAQRIKDTFAADVQLKEYGGYSDCVQALKTGAVDAVTTDDVILAGYAAQSPNDYKVVGNGFSNENYGVGIHKGDTAGTAAVSAALAEMIADGSWEKALRTRSGHPGTPSRRRRRPARSGADLGRAIGRPRPDSTGAPPDRLPGAAPCAIDRRRMHSRRERGGLRLSLRPPVRHPRARSWSPSS